MTKFSKTKIIFLGLVCFGIFGVAKSSLAADFYVDPDFNGTTRNGQPQTPFQSVAEAWSAINSQLESSDVTVYFSAREADSDVDEDYGNKGENDPYVNIRRTPDDVRTTRLILDGNSKWNTNDASPQWQNYSGQSRCHIHPTIDGEAMVWWKDAGKQNRITIRGFRITGGRLYMYGGDYVEVINNIAKHIYFEYANYNQEHTTNGGCHDINIINNDVSNSDGEGIYFGGAGNSGLNGHSNITIENNVVHDCGSYQGEGDGIDIKDGNANLVVRGNTSHDNHVDGIVSMSPGIYENNLVYSNIGNGLHLDTYWGLDWSAPAYVRNNVLYNNGANGIGIWASNAAIKGNIYVQNNSFRGNKNNVYVDLTKPISSITMQNNITSGALINEVLMSGTYRSTLGLTENNNNLNGTVSGLTPASTDIKSDPRFVSSADLHLLADSPCVNAGMPLSGFSTDKDGTLRPQGSSWDMGAYEYQSGSSDTTPPAVPSGLVVN